MKHWYIVVYISDRDDSLQRGVYYGKKWELIDNSEGNGSTIMALTRVDRITAYSVNHRISRDDAKKKFKRNRRRKKND